MRKIGLVIISSLLLAGCGGGGGGGGGASVVAEWLGTDPNAVITTNSGKTYDLTHGTPDANGSSYASNFNGGTYSFDSKFMWFGHQLNAYCGTAPCTQPLKISAPTSDVLTAWKAGWTGNKMNVLIWDSFYASQNVKPSGDDYHSSTTSLLAWQNAPGATFYGLDLTNQFSNSKVINTAGSALSNYQSNANLLNANRHDPAFYLDVVNISFGWDYQGMNSNRPTQQSDADQFIAYVSNSITLYTNVLSGVTPSTVFGNVLTTGSASLSFKDAVITAAAGNEAIPSNWSPLPYLLAHNLDLGSRTLIVGALYGPGSAGAKGSAGTGTIVGQFSYTDPLTHKTYYYGSNTAGTDLTVQNRFLVADGLSPFEKVNGVPGISVDGTATASYWGTSYAAPRVAGYAAIIRQKFPNLTAANTADILLQTARYDTLSCYPNCDKAIYGQGEASLSHALAPVGALR